jgi:ribonuclease P protein component
VAVVVSKKVHKSAVKRNRIRRRIFEIVRLESERIDQKFEMVFSIYSDQLIDWPPAKLKTEVVSLLKKSAAISTP